MHLTLRRGGLLLMAAGLVAALATIILGSAGNVGESAAQSGETPYSAPPSDRIGVLRRPTTPADAMPDRWKRQAAMNGVDTAALARARRVDTGGAVDYVIPSGGNVCVMQTVGDAMSYGCADPAAIAEKAALSVTTGSAVGASDGEMRISGLLQDRASHVAFVRGDGSRQPVIVKSNVFDAVASRSTKQFEWTDADGSQHSIPVDTTF